MNKYKLTDETITVGDRILHRIEALRDFGDVKKGDKGGFIEKEDNLSHEGDCWVFGDAWVSGEARVYGDAWVFNKARLLSKKNYTKGWFIGGDDTGKITNITDQTGSNYWKAHYVLGDYEITDQEPEKPEIKEMTVEEISKELGYDIKIVK